MALLSDADIGVGAGALVQGPPALLSDMAKQDQPLKFQGKDAYKDPSGQIRYGQAPQKSGLLSDADIGLPAVQKDYGPLGLAPGENLDRAMRDVQGGAAATADFFAGIPAFIGGFVARLGAVGGTMAAGGNAKESFVAGSEAANAFRTGGPLEGWQSSPFGKFVEMMGDKSTYDESLINQTMGKIQTQMDKAGEWVEKKSDGTVPKEAVDAIFEWAMVGGGSVGAKMFKGVKGEPLKTPPKDRVEPTMPGPTEPLEVNIVGGKEGPLPPEGKAAEKPVSQKETDPIVEAGFRDAQGDYWESGLKHDEDIKKVPTMEPVFKTESGRILTREEAATEGKASGQLGPEQKLAPEGAHSGDFWPREGEIPKAPTEQLPSRGNKADMREYARKNGISLTEAYKVVTEKKAEIAKGAAAVAAGGWLAMHPEDAKDVAAAGLLVAGLKGKSLDTLIGEARVRAEKLKGTDFASTVPADTKSVAFIDTSGRGIGVVDDAGKAIDKGMYEHRDLISNIIGKEDTNYTQDLGANLGLIRMIEDKHGLSFDTNDKIIPVSEAVQAIKKFTESLNEPPKDVILHLSDGSYVPLGTTDNIRAGAKQRGSIDPKLLLRGGAVAAGAALGYYIDKEDPIIAPVVGALAGAALATGVGRKMQAYRAVENGLKISLNQVVRKINPDALGPKAETTAAILASALTRYARGAIEMGKLGQERERFWKAKPPNESLTFLKIMELPNSKFKDPKIQELADYYRNWANELVAGDKAKGITYELEDNYIPHIFEDPAKVAEFLQNKYGNRFGDPGFTKERLFESISAAEAAGFKLKYTNPEQLFIARQMASDLAHAKVDTLGEMADSGLARLVKKGLKASPEENTWRSPNGELYFVGDHANQVLHNAFKSRSLWADESLLGLSYRGAMRMKNGVLPVMLGSLFHPIHLEGGMSFGTVAVNSIKSVAAGTMGVGEAIGKTALALTPLPALGRVKYTWQKFQPRGMRAFRGDIPKEQLTGQDIAEINNAMDGGFNPALSEEFRTKGIQALKDSIAQHSIIGTGKALPGAALNVYAKPIFENWIPALKWDMYQKAASTHLAANPELFDNATARKVALRRISKQIDDRFGEMQYKTMFMDKMVKDISVAGMLSYGWQAGFARSFIGAVPESWRAFTATDKANPNMNLRQKIASGQLDKTLFLSAYLTGTMLYGGLITWALTGEPPQSIEDYIFPRNGQKTPEGTPDRVSTPFYTRELLSIPYHIQQSGPVGGLASVAAGKITPVYGMLKGLLANKDFFNREISDPSSSIATQIGQRVQWALGEMEPIAVKSTSGRTAQSKVLAWGGFSPAPKYATNPPEAALIQPYMKNHFGDSTPWDRAQRSQAIHELYTLKASGDTEGFNKKMGAVQKQFNLSSSQMQRIERNADIPSTVRQFKILTAEEQKKVLAKMDPATRQRYLEFAKRDAR